MLWTSAPIRLPQRRHVFKLTDPLVSRLFREQMRTLACAARFTTVLGPGSDGYHEEHIHLDLIERSHGYRICQCGMCLIAGAVAAEVPLPRPSARSISSLAQIKARSNGTNKNGAGRCSAPSFYSNDRPIQFMLALAPDAPCAD